MLILLNRQILSAFLCFSSHCMIFQGYDSNPYFDRTLSMECQGHFFETGEYEEKEQYWTEAFMSFLNNNTRAEMIKIFESFGCFVYRRL